MEIAALLLFFAVCSYTCVTQTQSTGDSRQELMQAFVSSCGEVVPVSTGISCDVAFASFLSAFEGKSSLEPPPANQINYEGSYHTYLTTMEFFGPINNLVLFWSKTKPLQKALVSAGANIASSDSVYASKVVDQLYDGGISAWCSNTTGNISINEMCMMYDVGKMNTPAYVFWAEFSERLAEYAEGNAFFLTMNGTYQDTSFFGMFELPILLLPQSSTSKLVVINVVPADSSNVCGTGRLMSLESKATEVIEYKCFDIYGDAENPSDELVNCADQIINSVQEGMDDDSIVCVSSAISASGYATTLLMSCILMAAGLSLN